MTYTGASCSCNASRQRFLADRVLCKIISVSKQYPTSSLDPLRQCSYSLRVGSRVS